MNVYIPAGNITAMQGPAPEGFHVPLSSEWQGLKTIMDGLGFTTGDNWRINLHIPFAGYRNSYAANILNQGTDGRYWSSSPHSDYPHYARRLYLDSSKVRENNYDDRGYGVSIRCFKDTYVTPDSSWTVVQGILGSAGIFWNQSEGLISITNGTTGYTIQDKNLGATTVYNDGDTLSEANCGKYYQRGNNYGFAWTGNVTTSSTQVDASSYGPGNYYSSSTFIAGTGTGDWSSVQNDNLRGGVTGESPAELKNAYIGEYVVPYLCFTANTAGSTISLTKTGSPTAVTLEKSTDGNTWSTYTIGDTITLTNVGDKVYFRNTSTTDTGFSTSTSNYYKFVMTGSIAGSGDINYLLNKNSTTTVSSYCFYAIFFNCKALTKAPKLPATTLANYCYQNMFRNCISLTTAPSLPATTLPNNCYRYMFQGCTSLTSLPKLPATTLANECYAYMFYDCTSLIALPKLPATTLAQSCYLMMFYGCTSIKLSTTQTGEYQTAYRIPTTGTGTTATDALYYMFGNTGGTFTGTPSINTTYYTSNTVV